MRQTPSPESEGTRTGARPALHGRAAAGLGTLLVPYLYDMPMCGGRCSAARIMIDGFTQISLARPNFPSSSSSAHRIFKVPSCCFPINESFSIITHGISFNHLSWSIILPPEHKLHHDLCILSSSAGHHLLRFRVYGLGFMV